CPLNASPRSDTHTVTSPQHSFKGVGVCYSCTGIRAVTAAIAATVRVAAFTVTCACVGRAGGVVCHPADAERLAELAVVAPAAEAGASNETGGCNTGSLAPSACGCSNTGAGV